VGDSGCQCPHCKKFFSAKQHLKEHIDSGVCDKSVEKEEHTCEKCGACFGTERSLNVSRSRVNIYVFNCLQSAILT
jgi:hypothetical protein